MWVIDLDFDIWFLLFSLTATAEPTVNSAPGVGDSYNFQR